MNPIVMCGVVVVAGAGVFRAGAQVVLQEDFDTGVSSAIAPGSATRTGVQGFAGLGPAGNQFGSQFLRSPTGNTVTITLTDLPPHTSLSVRFLFAAIDSLDGTGSYPQGDFMNVKLDGVSFFRESFANASASQTQSYAPPAGVQLARMVDLGFSGPGSFYTDSAYDFGADPVFLNRPHTASSAVITLVMEGPGIQPLDDESWGMDNLRIVAENGAGACGPADIGGQGGTHGQDGELNNNDFIVFIDYFFARNIVADRGTQGGVPGQDSLFDNNDFIVYIDQFFAGC
jgi:hypothetical protein